MLKVVGYSDESEVQVLYWHCLRFGERVPQAEGAPMQATIEESPRGQRVKPLDGTGLVVSWPMVEADGLYRPGTLRREILRGELFDWQRLALDWLLVAELRGRGRVPIHTHMARATDPFQPCSFQIVTAG